ncbi:MAG TPA: DUF2281 domain-containing protein [bacterium]|nr:DUF2281 domain-containing protein [bacterium]
MEATITARVLEQIESLPEQLQQQVLDFAQALHLLAQKGTQGKQLLRFAGCIPTDELKRMSEAIETGCEQVDKNGW